MQKKQEIFKLKGVVQHYAWGGYDFIPQLLGITNNDHKPCAEYWLGAHPSAPSVVINGDDEPESLFKIIEQEPEKYIGKKVNDQFSELPYLLKILDVKDMLSIQVHPSKEEAVKGYEAEEAAGIPLNAPHRNYKDRNHKPEVMLALSDFWLLHGFKNEAALKQVLLQVPEFNFLAPIFESEGYYGLYKTVMELPQQKVDEVLTPLVKTLLDDKANLQKNEPGYWAAKVFDDGRSLQNIDRGIFSIYFFNVVEVKPGEAVYQGAGIPHAYLFGQNVELMANSDNVLRGGLTPKHIDVAELLKHTTFEAVEPVILKGESRQNGEKNYPCPVEDFGLSSISLKEGNPYSSKSVSAEIFIITEGEALINEGDLRVKKGEAFIVFANTAYTITTATSLTMYKAFIP